MSTQVAAGIASLWGPMHGGANEACIRMLREIGSKERIPEFLARAKDKNDPFKLMGFGHRVYRNIDPRAKEMKKLALDCIAPCGNQPVCGDLRDPPRHRAAAVAGTMSRRWRENLQAIEQMQLRGRRRVAGRPKFDFHTGAASSTARRC